MSCCESLGPRAYFIQTCIKYNLFQYVAGLIDTGQGMSVAQWQDLCTFTITQREQFIYKIESCMCAKLGNMANIQDGVHQWWKVAKAFPQSLKVCD